MFVGYFFFFRNVLHTIHSVLLQLRGLFAISIVRSIKCVRKKRYFEANNSREIWSERIILFASNVCVCLCVFAQVERINIK